MPSPEEFRALARSSPWRWTALHLRHRDAHREVEAWVHRPGHLVVRHPEHGDTVATGVPYSSGWVSLGEGAVSQPVPVHPQDAVPVLRPDGLVARRPDDPAVQYDDPLYGDYRWVAMLDPVELSHHVRLADVTAGERRGRPVWTARAHASPGYEPRCGCCPLLWSEVSEVAEQVLGGPTVRERRPDVVYPDGWDVALDVGTGVVVALHPAGPAHADHEQRWFEVDVLGADDDVAPPSRPRR